MSRVDFVGIATISSESQGSTVFLRAEPVVAAANSNGDLKEMLLKLPIERGLRNEADQALA